MDYAWLCVDLYGSCMELLWILCGLCMDFVWDLCDCYGFVMDFVWLCVDLYGFCMGSLRIVCGLCTDFVTLYLTLTLTLLQIAYCLLPITYGLLHNVNVNVIAYCLLPLANCITLLTLTLPINVTCCLLPIAGRAQTHQRLSR